MMPKIETINKYEQGFFAAQQDEFRIRKCTHGFLCSSLDPLVPGRIKDRGSVDIQFHDKLVKDLNLQPGMVVIDVGGYIGDTDYALTEAGCEVWSFEPYLENYLSLLWNMRHRNVHPFLCAVGNGERIVFNYEYHQQDCGMLYVREDPIGIPALPLDEIRPWHRLDFMKIDCEGREVRVLEGAEQTIREYRPIMHIESFPGGLKKQGFTVKDLHDKILSLDYTIDSSDTDYTVMRELVCLPK